MNLIYFPCWVVLALLVSGLKFQLLSQLYKFVLVTVLTAFILIEVARLYLGYLGISATLHIW
jgi:cytochrome b subunit of formate dehydrogenase